MDGRGKRAHFHPVLAAVLDQYRIFHADIRKSRHHNPVSLLLHCIHGVLDALILFFHGGKRTEHGNHLVLAVNVHACHIADIGKIIFVIHFHPDFYHAVRKIHV